MLRRSSISLIALVSLFLIWGCQEDPMSTSVEKDVYSNAAFLLKYTADSPFSTDLIAGGGNEASAIDVGDVLIWNDNTYLYVKYVIEDATPDDPRDDWHICETHLAVGDELTDIPQTKKGNPIPGQFEFSRTYDPYVAEDTYMISLADAGLGFGETVYVAAHSVVCQYGGLEGLEYSLPSSVEMKVKYPYNGGPAYFPELTVTNGGFLDGVYPGWCVDTDNTINQNTTYTANVYSSYESIPAGAIEFPENLDLVNWILNQDYIGMTSPGGYGIYTYGDVQRAIWTLVDDNNSTAGLGNWNQNRVNEILADAQANGEGFEPGCNDIVAVVLVPVNGSQVIIAQVVLFELQIICETQCETAWGDGMLFDGNNWATYIEYVVCEPGPTVTPGYSGLTKAAAVRYRGNSSGNEIYLGIPDLGIGSNRVEASYPNVYANWQDGTYFMTFSFDKAENKIVTTIDGTGGSESLEYDFDDLLPPGCPVSDWNALDINVVDRLTTGELAFNNVMLNGFSLGDFDDEGWKNWTVTGFDFSQSFTVSGDLVVSGWTGSETNKLSIAVGCLP